MKKFLLFLFLLFPAQALAAGFSVDEVISKSGLKAWLVQDNKLPLISFQMAWRGGVELDPPDQQGLARFCTGLLTQGAGALDSDAFQKQLADHSIQLSFSAGRDAISGGVKTLRETKDKAFDLLALALTAPRFDEPEMVLAKNQQKTGIQFSLSDAGWQGRFALLSHLFKGHPYAYRSLGTAVSVDRFAREDCRAFIRNNLTKRNLVVAAVGAISREEVAAVLDKIFGSLAEGQEMVAVQDVQPILDGAVLAVNREGTQSEIMWAAPLPRREDPDWYQAEIANYILGGGGFNARLMKAVREKEGLTYGIGTSLLAMDHSSFVMGSVAVENSRAGDVVDLVSKVWNDFAEEGPTEKEVESAKNYLIGAAPLALTTTSKIASWLVGLQLEGYGRDYLETRAEALRKTTRDDVQAFLSKWWKDAKVTWVAVGKPEGLSVTQKLESQQE